MAAPHAWGAGRLAVLALLLAPCAAAAPSCVDRGARAPEARCESLSYAGHERTYRLYVPAHPAAKAPLLVVLHGGGGGGAGMEALTRHGFNRRADDIGALVAYPDGVRHGWNDGRRELGTRAEDVDDVGFLRALVASLAERFALDSDRVFVTGISNGGMMTLRLACDASDLFTGFVAVAASLGETVAAGCRPAVPRKVALIAGTSDPLVPFAGGEVQVLGTHRGRVIGAEQTVAAFRDFAGCSGVEAESMPADSDGTSLVIRQATGCGGGASVVLYAVEGGGHAWPGGVVYAREWLIGKVSRAIDATDATWRFLGLGTGRHGPI